MRIYLIAFYLFISNLIIGQVKFEDFFENKTMRIDYYHSGSAIHEYFTLDKVITENEWSGLKTSLADIFDYGNHRFLIYDSTSNKLIFSRGFSSLFAEYRNSPKGKDCGNFSESFLMPLPKKTVNVEFYTRNKKNEWELIKAFYINPQIDIVPNTNTYKFDTEKIKYNGEPSKKLDIAFVAEGYTKEEMGKFIKDCQKIATSLLSIEPYKKNAKKINIWAVKSVSEESGVTIPTENKFVNTVLGSSYNTFDIERYLTSTEHFKIRDAASNVPYDQIYIIVNSNTYGGGGIYNFLCMGTSDNALFDFLLWHEFGHSLSGLADEYVSDDVAFQETYPFDIEPWEPNISTLVSFENKWQQDVTKNTPIPTSDSIPKNDAIGAFEGAGYVVKGVYRPMKDCIMRSANQKKYCTICNKAVEKAILFYAE